MKKLIALMTTLCMVLTTLVVPMVAFGTEGDSGEQVKHTIKLYLVNEDGTPESEPYFQIEVNNGQSMEEAQSQQDKYMEYPERLGAYCNWRTGTIGEDGKVIFGENDKYMDESTVSSVTDDYTFYSCWAEIPVDLDYELNITTPDNISVAEEGRKVLNRKLNNVLDNIAGYNVDFEDNYIYEDLPEEFIIEAAKQKNTEATETVEMAFVINEMVDEDDNLSGITCSCTLNLLDSSGNPVTDEDGNAITGAIDSFDSGIQIKIEANSNEGDCYYLAEVDESGKIVEDVYEDGTEPRKEFSWVEDGYLNYYWVVRGMSNYIFEYDEEQSGGGEGGGESYEVPADQIIIHYSFYTEDGMHNFYPVAVSIGEINETGEGVVIDEEMQGKTIQQLVDENDSVINKQHYQHDDLEFESWSITGSSNDVELKDIPTLKVGNCRGGFTVYANAKYKDGAAPVQTLISYYGEDGSRCSDTMTVIINDAKNKTSNDVYDALDDTGVFDGIDHYANYEFKEWNYLKDRTLFSSGEEYAQEIGLESDYIHPLEFTATYNKQPVQINCTYKDSAGEAVTVSGETIVDTTKGENIYTGFEAFLEDNKIPTGGVKSWNFDSNTANNWEENGGQPNDVINVAAAYETSTPIFYSRNFINCDSVDGMYYRGDEYDRIMYVDAAFPTDDSEEKMLPYNEKVTDVATEKFGKDPSKDLKFMEYAIDYVEYNTSTIYTSNKYLYRCAANYVLVARYDKACVETIGADGTVDQELVDFGSKYTVGEEGKGELWNIEGANFGGDAIPGGSDITIESPYTRFTMWTLVKNPLEAVPESLAGDYSGVDEIQSDLDIETQNAESWDSGTFQSDYYEVVLLKFTEGAELVPVSNEDFPEEGIWVEFEYPEGTDKDTNFVITHMFAYDAEVDGVEYKAGDVEVIKEGDRLVKTDRGIKVLMYALSPISLAYGDTANSGGEGDDPIVDPSNGNSESADSTDSAADTGDSFNMLPIIAAMLVAAAGAAFALRRRSVE